MQPNAGAPRDTLGQEISNIFTPINQEKIRALPGPLGLTMYGPGLGSQEHVLLGGQIMLFQLLQQKPEHGLRPPALQICEDPRFLPLQEHRGIFRPSERRETTLWFNGVNPSSGGM